MNKILICYFSATRTTRNVSEKIANTINADLFEIEPEIKYTSADLNWHDKNSRSSIEMEDKTSRPAIKNKIENLGEYNKVVIGFPVWWYTAPTIINTFIEENNLKDKKVYIFVTSGGSGVEGSFNDLKNTYTDINFINAKRFDYSTNEEEIKLFVDE